ncbi:type II secretion system protein [Bacillus spongiae]|uniref:Type II secretion system protein n=1 Tax=Bacillus spongiae TaxID=2683610 RepID=A0ABU8HGA9_9BACI
MKNNRGYALPESLIALFSLFFLVASIFPVIYIQYEKQRQQERELESARVMFEEVENVFFTSAQKQNEEIKKGEGRFQLIWEIDTGVCVKQEGVVLCVRKR